MAGDLPRTLLLSWQRPDGRYAGAEALRKVVRQLPRESLRWAYLAVPMAGETSEELPEHRGFACRSLSWRLRRYAISYWYAHNFQAAGVAGRIAQWVKPFQPELIWVLAELGAVNVADCLSRRLGIPVHATVHDSYSFARFAVPRRYYPLYRRDVARLMTRVRSMDAVTEALLNDVRGNFAMPQLASTLVMPPSVSRRCMAVAGRTEGNASQQRVIGLCGSLRIGEEQWMEFLQWLDGLSYTFRLLVFAERSAFFDTALPPMVRIEFLDYARTESEVIRRFQEERANACYLGLTQRPEQREFAAHSLSSKLATYAAAAVPVIVHGPRESAAWGLVERYDAGILCDKDGDAAGEQLSRLFSDTSFRRRKAAGAERLCREQFDLERNVAGLATILSGLGNRRND
jgi:hypothetical protein